MIKYDYNKGDFDSRVENGLEQQIKVKRYYEKII